MRLLIAVLQVAIVTAGAAQGPGADRVRLRFDTAEAVAALSILEARQAGRPEPEGAWQRLFAAAGDRRSSGWAPSVKGSRCWPPPEAPTSTPMP